MPGGRKRPDLIGKSHDEQIAELSPEQRLDALEAENALLREELEASRRREEQNALDEVRKELQTVGVTLPAALASFDGLEAFLEDTLRNDSQTANADKASAEAIDAYSKDLEPGEFSIIGSMIEVATGLKGIAEAARKVTGALRSGASTAEKMSKLVGPQLEVLGAVKGGGAGVAALAGLQSDTSKPAINALNGLGKRIQAVRDGLVDAQRFLIAKAKSDVTVDLTQASISMERALRLLPQTNLTDPSIPELMTRIESIAAKFDSVGGELQARMDVLAALHAARGTRGRAGLERGTATRSVFEQLVRDENLRGRAVLIIEQRLEVRSLQETQGVLRPYRWRIDVGDHKLQEDWGEQLTPVLERGLHTDGDTQGVVVPDELGRALEAVVPKVVKLPPQDVHLAGNQGETTVPMADYFADPRRYRDMAFGATPTNLDR